MLIRATRYKARLGWELDPKTLQRYENAKGEGVIEFLSAHGRSQELEQIGHEEDALKVLDALNAEGWMEVLFPPWTPAKADEEKLKALHDLAVELLIQGVHADMSAAQMRLLTARLNPKDLASLKKLMLRPGFVEEWNSLDNLAAGFSKVLLAKENATPSAGFKLFTTYDPEAILWLGFTSKSAAVLDRFNLFLKVWPEARQRIPYALMQEMRITQELPAYNQIVHSIFLQLIDGKLTTPEEMRGFLEPHSPPAPPPQVTIKRPRAKRGAEAKVKEQAFDDEDADDSLDDDEDLDDIGADDDEIDLGLPIPKLALDENLGDDDSDEDDVEAPKAPPVEKDRAGKKAAAPKLEKPVPAVAPLKPGKPAEAVPAPAKAAKSQPEPKAKVEPKAAATAAAPPAKAAPAAAKAKPAQPAAKKAVPAPAKVVAKPAKAPAKAPAKPPVKKPAKVAVKAPVKKPVAKVAPAKAKPASKPGKAAKPAKPVAKKPAPKPAKKR